MTKSKLAMSIALALTVTACGSGSSSSGDGENNQTDPVVVPGAVDVTEDNIAEALDISNAQMVEGFQSTAIPEGVASEEIEISNVEEVVVTANSSYRIQLSVPESEVPQGKRVGGYLIELPGNDFAFVPAAQAEAVARQAAQKLVGSAPTNKKKQQPKYASLNRESGSVSSFAVGQSATEIVFEGWSNAEFELDESLAGLSLRIFPLLVNESVLQVTDISQIDLTQEENWLGVQELTLAVEAVATATIQVSLTWNAETDLDLWVIEPDGEKIFYSDTISETSLGWLDYDNTEAYGPENITFNYQMPVGDYKVYVHHYRGYTAADYQVVVAVGDEVNAYSGSFAQGVTSSSEIGGEGVHFIADIAVDATLNAQLATPVALSQVQGIWRLPEESSVQGYVAINETEIGLYRVNGDVCSFVGRHNDYEDYQYLPTGFFYEGGEMAVSDAVFGIAAGTNQFTYQKLSLTQTSLPDHCSGGL